MITEDYVSFETAKLLKEKGFNKDTYTMSMYDENGEAKDVLLLKEGEEPVLRPTLQMTMKWLREVHGLFIFISTWTMLENNIQYYFEIREIKTFIFHEFQNFEIREIKTRDFETLYDYTSKELNSFEEAAEAAIKYCLKNLI